MVIVMKLNHVNMNNYLHKPSKDTAIKLHKLYESDSVHVPTAEQIVIHHLRLDKYFREEFKEIMEYDANDESTMELCDLIGVDFEDVKPISDNGDNYAM